MLGSGKTGHNYVLCPSNFRLCRYRYFNARTGSTGVQNNTFGILQLEEGSVATAFQTATGTLQGELAACQRYYQRKTSVGNATVFGIAVKQSSTEGFTIQFRTPGHLE